VSAPLTNNNHSPLLSLDVAGTRNKTNAQPSKECTLLLTRPCVSRKSGIGLYASKLFRLVNPQNRLILVARNQIKAEMTKMEVESVSPEGSRIIAMSCDMTSMASVREFTKNLRQLVLPSLGKSEHSLLGGIDVLCLNAAVLVSGDAEPSFTEDGLEETFQTNYLAPFLIVNLIHDLINANGRIITTTSGLHIGPRFANFQGIVDVATGKPKKCFLMVDGSEYDYKKCYALSKLCVTAFCLALHRKLESRKIVSNCFTPGLLPTSGLFRHQKKKIVSFFHDADETIEWGGGALAWMALADDPGRRGGQFFRAPMGSSRCGGTYGREFCSSPVSKEACNQLNQELLWKLSAQLAGIPDDLID
jgi:NAD(P)-dependent dehydrogenase (short-subunit alcohol dehydrogenase family)